MTGEAAAGPAPAGRSLGAAVVTAVALVGLIVTAFVIGRIAFFVLVCAVVLIALFELLEMLVRSGRRVPIPFGVLCGFGLLLSAFLEQIEWAVAVVAVTAFGGLLLALRPGRGEKPATDVGWMVLGVTWVAGGGAGATSILMLPGGRLLLVAFIVVVALGDIGAYFVGVERGRHKIAPSISPAKSWEGLAAGFVTALMAGQLVAGVLFHISVVEGIGLSLVVAVFGPTGDLVESMVKREIGTKDSGTILPGHGGFLDRLDAIVFSAPAVYLYLRFIVLG